MRPRGATSGRSPLRARGRRPARRDGQRGRYRRSDAVTAPHQTDTVAGRAPRYLPAGALAVLVAASACALSPPDTLENGGDPGDLILHALVNDPVMAHPPIRGTTVHRSVSAAHYKSAGGLLTGSGWQSPVVEVCIRPSQSPVAVFRQVSRAARRAGWQPIGAQGANQLDSWSKPGPGGPNVIDDLTFEPNACVSGLSPGTDMLTANGSYINPDNQVLPTGSPPAGD